MTPLHYAVFFGWVDCVKNLLAAGANKEKSLTYMNESGRKIKTYSLLHLCVINDQLETAKLLLQEGVPINHLDLSHETVLHKAASVLSIDFVTLFLEFKDKNNANNKVDVNGFSLKMHTPLHCAINAQYRNRFDDKEPLDLSLIDPAFPDKFEVIEYLVSQGALVEYGVDNLPSHPAKQQYKYSYQSGGSKISQLRSSVQQPLVMAVELGSPKLVKFFIMKNADVNWVTTKGYNMASTPVDLVEEWIKIKTKEWENKQKEKNETDPRAKYLPKNTRSFTYFEMKYDIEENSPDKRKWGRAKKIKRATKGKISTPKTEKVEKSLKIHEHKMNLHKEILECLTKKGGKQFTNLKLQRSRRT